MLTERIVIGLLSNVADHINGQARIVMGSLSQVDRCKCNAYSEL